MAKFYGLILYEIYENGNLINGIYTNTGLSPEALGGEFYAIDNEIAQKRNPDNNGLAGTYECRFIERINSTRVTTGVLIIRKLNEVYEFQWNIEGKRKWNGIGIMVNDRHIAVSYSTP